MTYFRPIQKGRGVLWRPRGRRLDSKPSQCKSLLGSAGALTCGAATPKLAATHRPATIAANVVRRVIFRLLLKFTFPALRQSRGGHLSYENFHPLIRPTSVLALKRRGKYILAEETVRVDIAPTNRVPTPPASLAWDSKSANSARSCADCSSDQSP